MCMCVCVRGKGGTKKAGHTVPESTRVCKSLEVLQQSVPLGSLQCCDLDFWTAVERLLALRLDTSTGPPFSMLSQPWQV